MAVGPDRNAEIAEKLRLLLKKSLVEGDKWYLIETNYFKKCKRHIGLDEFSDELVGSKDEHPGPIDNAELFCPDTPGEIKDGMLESINYCLVPEEAWSLLVNEFGTVEGQEPIGRTVREFGMFMKQCKVEVYTMCLQLCKVSDQENITKKKFSRGDTVGKVKSEMHTLFNIPEDKETRLWNRYSANVLERLKDLDQSISLAGVYKDQLLLIEEQNEDGTWSISGTSGLPNGSASVSSSNHLSSSDSNNSSTSLSIIKSSSTNGLEKKETSSTSSLISSRYNHSSYLNPGTSENSKPGICGLANLGNTCFMNSIIQGLSNTPQVVEYFENDNYEEDINVDNPLGMKGEIARAFGQLIQDLWSGRYGYIDPRQFKTAVGKFAPMFSGYQQQDSQELLTFLLDGLHEDLNRIKQKPYMELSDSEGKEDAEVAREAWEHHKKRNDSVILDIFHGLLKSTLVCPECTKVSVKFDPMCYLSLPLPVKKERQIEIFFIPMAHNLVPVQYKVTVPKNGTISDLYKAIHKVTDVPSQNLIATDVYNHRFHKIYKTSDELSQIMDRDEVFVYEVGDQDDKDQAIVPVYLRKRSSSSTYSPASLFGRPYLVPVPSNLTSKQLYQILLEKMSRYVSRPKEGEEWWQSAKPEPQTTDNNLPPPPPPPPTNNTTTTPTTSNNHNGHVEKMETSGDSEGCSSNSGSCSSSTDSSSNNSVNNVDAAENTNNMPVLVTGEETTQSSATQENIQPSNSNQKPMSSWDLEMSDDEDSNDNQFHRLFTMAFVNSYGNSILESIPSEDDAEVSIAGRRTIGLDWHPKAAELFYQEKAAEEYTQDSSVSGVTSNVQKKQVLQLSECLKLYTTQEKLGADDAWYCPNCKKLQEATKKFDLWMLPEVLVIHLKRFSYSRYMRDKIDALIQFPIEGLDMTPYVIQPGHGKAVYDLIAVSNHYGGMGGGHYTAFGKNKNDGKWYYFDDSNVTEAQGEIVTKAAYVLFYKRRTPSRASPPSATVVSGAGAADPPTVNGTTPNGIDDGHEDMDVDTPAG